MTNEDLLIEGGQQQSLADGIDSTRLTAGTGHDFNHVLNIIRGYAELLLEELRHNDAARENLTQINKAIESGALLSRQLVARAATIYLRGPQ